MILGGIYLLFHQYFDHKCNNKLLFSTTTCFELINTNGFGWHLVDFK